MTVEVVADEAQELGRGLCGAVPGRILQVAKVWRRAFDGARELGLELGWGPGLEQEPEQGVEVPGWGQVPGPERVPGWGPVPGRGGEVQELVRERGGERGPHTPPRGERGGERRGQEGDGVFSWGSCWAQGYYCIGWFCGRG